MEDVIFRRRSIRSYTDQQVTKEQEEKILRAAMAAPSARNLQPWEFLVMRDKSNFEKIMSVHPYSKMLKEASLAIVVCGNEERNLEGLPYWHVDCAAAIQNILLEVTNLGLGAVWLGVYPREERMEQIAKICELPDNIKPLGIVSIGYPKTNPEPADRYDASKVHFEKW